MSKLTFYTSTTLDEAFIFTMGASVKKSNNPIGFFGTGLKYAIAVTLRLGGNFTIQTNQHIYGFRTKKQTIRGEEMDFIECVKDNHTNTPQHIHCPMVVDYGKTWQPWMVMRELWSNTKDEGGQVYEGDIGIDSDSEYTIITVEHPDIYDAWLQRDRYILNPLRHPLYENHNLQIFQGPSNTFFYRGIAVSTSNINSQFTYNFKDLGWRRLTEDRTIAADDIKSYINNMMHTCGDKHLVESFLRAACTPNTLESTLPFGAWELNETSSIYTAAAVEVVRENLMAAPTPLKEVVHTYLLNRSPESFYKPCIVSDECQDRFIECKEMLEKAGFDFSSMNIYFTDKMPAGHYGSAYPQNSTIILNYNWTIDHVNWKKQTCCTLIEEYIHIKFNARDHSREMQEAYNNSIYFLLLNGNITKPAEDRSNDLPF